MCTYSHLDQFGCIALNLVFRILFNHSSPVVVSQLDFSGQCTIENGHIITVQTIGAHTHSVVIRNVR